MSPRTELVGLYLYHKWIYIYLCNQCQIFPSNSVQTLSIQLFQTQILPSKHVNGSIKYWKGVGLVMDGQICAKTGT